MGKFRSSAIFPTIHFDRNSKTPAYKQVYEEYRSAILQGRLHAGTRIPSTRDVARDLNVSRNTVINAFEQLLAEGYLRATTGSGTYVNDVLPEAVLKATARGQQLPSSKSRQPGLSRRGQAYLAMTTPSPKGLGAFRLSLPALDQFPIEIWSKLIIRQTQMSSRQMLAYSDSAGYYPLREAIAEYVRVARAVKCEADQVLIVSGSQQALHLCARLLADAGDPVWLEDPGYFGARFAFASSKAKLVPVPVDKEGLDVMAGIRLASHPKTIYVTPSHQYPLGMTMSLPRRLQLIQYAQRSGAWVIEDDYDSEYRYVTEPVSALQGLDGAERVIYIGTFSKMLFPSLRIGYIVVPPALVPAFKNAREVNDIFCPTFLQAVLHQFIKEGHFARHIRRMRVLYMERNKVLVDELQKNLAEFVTVEFADAGMHLVAELLPDSDDDKLSQTASKAGVITVPLSPHYLGKKKKQGLVLGYGGTDALQISEGVRRLKSALLSYRQADGKSQPM
jgi:GntR family transcriptional regulator/MocR family aminotransferase